MTDYQNRLEAMLSRNGWEVVSVEQDASNWWRTEHWRVRSIQQAWGSELILNFLVDPLSPTAAPIIAEVSATQSEPSDRTAALSGVAVLEMFKGNFEHKVRRFMDNLNAWRSRQTATT